jgi:signal transduction histidine kinase
LQAEDEERRRIAKELHDSTAQDIVAVMMNLGMLQESPGGGGTRASEIIADSLAILENSVNDIRTLSYLVHPPRLDEAGLVGALTEYVAGFSRRAALPVQLEVSPGIDRLPADVELTLFRVVQESLANVLRHSQSATAAIRLLGNEGGITLEVIDQGRGLESAGTPQRAGLLGVGITGMRERMQHLGGRLEVESSSAGTTVRAVLHSLEQMK